MTATFLSRIVRALRALFEPAAGEVNPLPDLPEVDPAVVARLTPGLRELLEQSRSTRAQLVDLLGALALGGLEMHGRGIHGIDSSSDERAGEAMVQARTLLDDLVRHGESLPSTDHAALSACGFPRDRFTSLPLDTAAEARKALRRPRATRERLHRALTDLVALELCILDTARRSPYR